MTFEDFWSAYPHPENRGDKNRARMRYERLSNAGLTVDMRDALEKYGEYLAREKWQAAMMCATWLGSDKAQRWRDWLPELLKPKTLIEALGEEVQRREFLELRAVGIAKYRARLGQPEIPIAEIMDMLIREKL